MPPSPVSAAAAVPAPAGASAWLRALLILVVTVLALAAWGFVVLTDELARASAGDAEALNLAGRQSFLAERLVVEAVAVGSGEDTALPMASTLSLMMADAVRLYELRGPRVADEDSPSHWTTHRERLWAAAQSLQMARERGEVELARYVARVQAEARQFVTAMEAATGELQALAEARQRETKQAHTVMVSLLAIGAACLLLGLGEPLARRIQRHHGQLLAQAQQLERLAMVADRTQNGVVLTDGQGLLVWANQGFTRITGFSPDEVLGRTPASFLQFEGTDPATRETLNRALAGGEPVRVQILNRSKQGRHFWVDLDIQPLRDAAGRVTGFVQVTTDITDQVERRDYLNTILRTLPAGLLVQDSAGRISEANLRACELLGRPLDALIGADRSDPAWDVVDEAGAPLSTHEMPAARALRTGAPQHDQLLGIAWPDGRRRWLRVNTQVLPAPGGRAQGVVSCFVDETDLREKRHLLRMTIDGAGVGTWNWEVGTDALHYNEGWAAMLGYGPGELPPRVRAFQALMHPDDLPGMREAMHRHLKDPQQPYRSEYRLRRKDGDWLWVLTAGAVIERSADGRAKRMAGVHLDITARKDLEHALGEAARTDALTQLPNRAGIQQALARCVARAHARPGHQFAVLFMDFDRFKLVNDSLGHDAGDELLRQIADRVRHALRPGDDVARLADLPRGALPDVAGRLGGDEFVVLLEHIHHASDATQVAQRLLDSLAAPYAIAGRSVQSSASIGIVTSQVSSASVESVLRDADTAMYEAKRRGRGRYVLFDPEMHHRIRDAMDLEGDLRVALQQGDLFVVYQPIVALDGPRQPVGLEALARWHHPTRGPVSPAEFVPLAEEAGLVEALGEQVLRRACRDLAAWQRRLGASAPRTVAVNLSRAQLRPGLLAAMVRSVLAESGLPPSALRLEVTETLAMQGEAALGVLEELRAMGVSLALDDFGTGYSSLASLDQLPIDTVKIDRAFVAKMVHSRYQTALVKSTVQVADALSLKVVAEGVESEAQASALAALGCHAAQGYLFGRPMPAEDLLAWWQLRTRAGTGRALPIQA